MRVHQRLRGGQVVVGRHHVRVGHVDRRTTSAETQQAPVVSPVEHHDLRPGGEGLGRGQRQQAGFRARVGETHQGHRRKTPLDLCRQRHLAPVVGREAQAIGQRVNDGLPDHGVRVAVQPRGELSQGIEVAVTVGVPQAGPLTPHHGQWKRRMKQHAARIAPGHDGGRLGQLALAGRVAFAVARAGGFEGIDEVHGRSFTPLLPVQCTRRCEVFKRRYPRTP
ncbi:hypothetical protein D9M68_759470 [compost metagenome]